MLSSGRNDLKNIPILGDTIKLPISVFFILSPEMKGAQECSEKQLKLMGGSEANQTTPNSINYSYNKCRSRKQVENDCQQFFQL